MITINFDQLLNALHHIEGQTSDPTTREQLHHLRKDIEKNGLNEDANTPKLFPESNFDQLLNQHFPPESWYDSEPLDMTEEDNLKWKDLFTVFGGDAFEKDYGTDPIGCIYVDHNDNVYFLSHL